MEVKIIESKNLQEFENLVNEYFFLIDWFNRKPSYFKKEYIKKRHIATIIIKNLEISDTALGMKTIRQKELLENDVKLKERLFKALNRFYPERQTNW